METVKRYLIKAGPRHVMLLHHVIEQPELLDRYRMASTTPDSDSQFMDGEQMPILIGSESSTRGLHVGGLDVVYIVSRPQNSGEYLHMAGRTGRCGRPGKVVSLCTSKEVGYMKVWAKLLRFDITEQIISSN